MADSSVTKNALASALKRLMKKQGFEKISVSEICEECGMNRKSFYYHFRDKYDLVNWIFYEDFLGHLQTASYEDGWDALKDLCESFFADREFYLEALKIEGQNSFREYVIDTVKPLALYFSRDVFSEDSEKDFFYTFFADAFLHAISRWLRENDPISPEEFVKCMRSVLVNIAFKTAKGDETQGLSSPTR
ncbi:MAG: TetR/AcrR family transcriptional regulator C-terminal domain-containing protein [Lachnospiraceae bacterium]|nr:TetR/AcrR family transcriptional regulator C-terminal domain-containing protein [Lachnospiraceae bacterium]